MGIPSGPTIPFSAVANGEVFLANGDFFGKSSDGTKIIRLSDMLVGTGDPILPCTPVNGAWKFS